MQLFVTHLMPTPHHQQATLDRLQELREEVMDLDLQQRRLEDELDALPEDDIRDSSNPESSDND